jgi:hypothetical protein
MMLLEGDCSTYRFISLRLLVSGDTPKWTGTATRSSTASRLYQGPIL